MGSTTGGVGMKRKYFILMLNVAAVVMLSIMYGAKNATMGMRFLLPGMAVQLCDEDTGEAVISKPGPNCQRFSQGEGG